MNNILIICKSLPDSFKGGIQTHTWNLASELQKGGNQVTILTAGGWKKTWVKFAEDGFKVIKLKYFPGRYVPGLRILFEELFFNIAVAFFLLKRQERYHLIHAQGRSGYLLPWVRKKGWMITCHGLISMESRANGLSSPGKWLHQWITSLLEANLIRKAPRVIAVSQALKSMIQDTYGITKPIDVIPNGIHSSRAIKDESLGKKLVFVGRLEKAKGILDLLEVVKSIPELDRLLVIGDGTLKPRLQKIISSNPILREKVRLFGGLPAHKVDYWIGKSTALILPSYLETQGIVLMEAWARKKPVLASALPAIREMVIHQENGLLFQPGDHADMKKQISLLINNRSYSRELGEKGHQLILDKYSWQSIAVATAKLYNLGTEYEK